MAVFVADPSVGTKRHCRKWNGQNTDSDDPETRCPKTFDFVHSEYTASTVVPRPVVASLC